MIVYKATNTTNGKVYVGKTVRTLSHAKARHKQRALKAWKYGTQSRFYSALRKYGFDCFQWEVLFQGSSDAEIQMIERVCIYLLRSCDPDIGYNMTPGGDGGAGKTLSEGQKQKLSEAFSGEKNHCFGKFGPDHPAFGNRHSEETRIKIRAGLTGKPKTEAHKAALRAARLKTSRYTEADRLEMYKLRTEDKMTYQAIADRFDSSPSVVRDIVLAYQNV